MAARSRTVSHREPAASIIDRLGGFDAVAEMLGVARTTVLRFALPAPDGRDGQIPAKYRSRLIAEAARTGIELTYEDFAWRPATSRADAVSEAPKGAMPPKGAPDDLAGGAVLDCDRELAAGPLSAAELGE